MKQGFEGCIGVYVKGVPVFEDSAFVGGGTDTGVEPGDIPNTGRAVYQVGWASPPELGQGSPCTGAWGRVPGEELRHQEWVGAVCKTAGVVA